MGKFSPTFFCTYLLQLLSVSSLPSTSVLPSHVLILISPGFSPPHNPFTGPTLTSPAQSLSTSAAAFALVLTNSALSPPLSTPQGSFKRGCSHIMSAKLGPTPTPTPTHPPPTADIIYELHLIPCPSCPSSQFFL